MNILCGFFEQFWPLLCYVFCCMRTGAAVSRKESYSKFTCVRQRILRPRRFDEDFLNNFGLSFAMCSAACALELGYTVSRKESYVKFMRQSTQLLGVLCVRGCSRSLLEDLLNVLTRVRGYSVLNFSKIIEF